MGPSHGFLKCLTMAAAGEAPCAPASTRPTLAPGLVHAGSLRYTRCEEPDAASTGTAALSVAKSSRLIANSTMSDSDTENLGNGFGMVTTAGKPWSGVDEGGACVSLAVGSVFRSARGGQNTSSTYIPTCTLALTLASQQLNTPNEAYTAFTTFIPVAATGPWKQSRFVQLQRGFHFISQQRSSHGERAANHMPSLITPAPMHPTPKTTRLAPHNGLALTPGGNGARRKVPIRYASTNE